MWFVWKWRRSHAFSIKTAGLYCFMNICRVRVWIGEIWPTPRPLSVARHPLPQDPGVRRRSKWPGPKRPSSTVGSFIPGPLPLRMTSTSWSPHGRGMKVDPRLLTTWASTLEQHNKSTRYWLIIPNGDYIGQLCYVMHLLISIKWKEWSTITI